MRKLQSADIRFCEFREPDKNNELTSIACEPVAGEKRSLFTGYPLMGAESNLCANAV